MPVTEYQVAPVERRMRKRDWLIVVLAAVVPLLGGFAGARLFNSGKYKNDEFDKPSWAPPSWLFSPIWTLLYLAMGVASFVVWKCGGGLNGDTLPALLLYALQLLVNWCWTPAFFGFGRIGAALALIAVTWGLAVACVVSFWPTSKVASLLLVPYVAWLTFAMALNHEILCLNGCALRSNGTAAT